jgi:hypothetical protein
MPVMWFSKDGPRPHSQSGPGTSVSIAEAHAIVGTHEIKFVGAGPPSVNSDRPSSHVKNVVLQVESPSISGVLNHVGFYLVLGLKPQEAEQILVSLRAKV